MEKIKLHKLRNRTCHPLTASAYRKPSLFDERTSTVHSSVTDYLTFGSKHVNADDITSARLFHCWIVNIYAVLWNAVARNK